MTNTYSLQITEISVSDLRIGDVILSPIATAEFVRGTDDGDTMPLYTAVGHDFDADDWDDLGTVTQIWEDLSNGNLTLCVAFSGESTGSTYERTYSTTAALLSHASVLTEQA